MRGVRAFLWLAGVLCTTAAGLRAGEATFEVRAVTPRAGLPGTSEYELDDGGGEPVKLALGSEVLLDTAALASAEAKNEAGGWVIAVELTAAGSQRFEEVTTRFLDQRLAILINGKARCAPVVRSAITGGSFEIAGNFTEEEVKALAVDLNTAAKKEPSPAPAATPGSP